MVTELNKQRISKKIDLIMLWVLGIFCSLYSAFFYYFAELNIQFSFLDFPIFVGEILLMLSITGLFVKWRVSSIKFSRWHYLLFAYILFILVKAFWGYSKWGPLALRNSALFYYSLFAVVGYYFYRRDFFKNKFIYTVILSILVVTVFFRSGYKTYYFDYVMLIVLLIFSGIKSNKWRYIFLALFMLTCYNNILVIFVGGRSIMVSSFIACLFFTFVFLKSFLNIKFKYKITGAVIIFIILSLFLWNITNKIAFKSLVKLNDLKRTYKQRLAQIGYIYQKDFKFAEPQVKVYEENCDNPFKVKFQSKPQLKSQPNPAAVIKNLDIDKIIPYFQETSKEELAEIVLAETTAKVQSENQVVSVFKSKVLRNDGKINDPIDIYPTDKKTQAKNTFKNEGFDGDKDPIGYAKVNKNKSKQELIDSILIKNNLIKENKEDVVEIISIDKYQIKRERVISDRNLEEHQNSMLYRFFICQEMIDEIIKSGKVIGADFGKPFRSEQLQLLRMDEGWKERVGWVEPHNSYIHMVYRAGFVGFLLIITVWSLFVKMTITFIKIRNIKGILLASCVIYWLVISNFMVILELPYYAIPFWILFGMSYRYSIINRSIYLKGVRR